MTKTMKWIVAGLVLSLAANVFFIGFAIGKRVLGPESGRASGPPPEAGLNMRALGQYLSAEDKEAAQRLLGENRRLLRAKGGQMRQNQRDTLTVLTEETIDSAALSRLLDQHDTLVSETHQRTRRLVLEFIATLDVETRRSLAKDLFKKKRRGPPPRGGDRRDRRLGDRPVDRPGDGSDGGGRDFDRPQPPEGF